MAITLDFGGSYGLGLGATYTRVRGGGAAGGRAWVARITGYDPNSQWKWARQFCGKDTAGLSGSGRSGTIIFHVDEPGLYEYSDFAYNSRRGCRGFFLIEENGSVSTVERPYALQLATAMSEGKPATKLEYGVRP